VNVYIDDVRYVPASQPCENPELLDFVCWFSDMDRDASIREFLHELLSTMWEEGEGFSGKRPLGNSGWEHQLYTALVRAGAITGKLDDDEEGRGCADIPIEERQKANTIVFSLIAQMCGVPK